MKCLTQQGKVKGRTKQYRDKRVKGRQGKAYIGDNGSVSHSVSAVPLNLKSCMEPTNCETEMGEKATQSAGDIVPEGSI